MEESFDEEKREFDPKAVPDFLLGLGIFFIVGILFLLTQTGVFLKLLGSKSGSNRGFNLDVLSDPSMQQQMNELMENGDVIAEVTMWSGIVCSAAVLILVGIWKKSNITEVLAIRAAPVQQFAKWLGIFILVMAGIELLGLILPDLHSDFMDKVMRSVTDKAGLIIGVGIMAPVFEELLLRGLLLHSVRRISTEHIAIAVSAFVFTILHLQYEVLIMLLILPLGVVLGYARTRTGSIWVPIVLHIVNNTGSILLYPYLSQG